MTSPSAPKDNAATASPPGSQRFPQFRRLRKRAEFKKVYEEGERLSTVFFAAFCRRLEQRGPGRIGLTVPRTLGNAVTRNRVKRRLREAVRRHWSELPDGCEIVVHARRRIVEADWPSLEREVARLFQRAGRPRTTPPQPR